MSKKRRKATRERKQLPGETSLLIKDADVVTMDPDGRIGRLDIRIEGRRIVEVASRLKARLGDEVIAAKGMVAIPGLVQAHVHTCHSLLRNQADGLGLLDWLRARVWPFEGAMTAEDVRDSARLGIAELLLNGTTSVLDTGTVRHGEESFKAAKRLGIRYTGGKLVMDQGQGFPAGLRETTAEALAESARLSDQWHGKSHGRLRYAYTLRSPLTCSTDALRGCADQARARRNLVQIHVASHPDEIELFRSRAEGSGGADQVEYLYGLGLTGPDVVLHHGVWLPLKGRKILAETGTRLVHCPARTLQLGGGLARLPELLADGIDVALGTASGRFDGFAEMRLTTLVHRNRGGPGAVPAATVLAMATTYGARALGLSDVGAIRPGHRADIVLLDLNRPHAYPPVDDWISRIVFCARGSDVHTVLVDGKIVVEAGELATADTANILKAAKRSAARLAKRVD